MRKVVAMIALLAGTACSLLGVCPADGGSGHVGKPLIIELDNAFIKTYANRATITSQYTITGISKDHEDKADGEVHIGGWTVEAGLPSVAEVMNVHREGKKADTAFRAAFAAGQKQITVTGAWRIWGEHDEGMTQIQALGPKPAKDLAGLPSNPKHVFEIHPVTSVKVADVETDAAEAIGEIQGFKPKDAHNAFVVLFERTPCKIIPKGKRTRIITQGVQLNFTEFLIRADGDLKDLDDGGHSLICSVFDLDGDLLVRNRRMIFIKGTKADDAVKKLKKDGVLHVVGFARLDLALVQWRLDNQNAMDENGEALSPLEWRLPYEMLIVSAKPFTGEVAD